MKYGLPCNFAMQLNLEIRANVSTFIVSTCILGQPRRLVSPPRRSPFTKFTGRRHAVHNGTRWRRRSPVSRSSVRPSVRLFVYSIRRGLSNVSPSLEDTREENRSHPATMRRCDIPPISKNKDISFIRHDNSLITFRRLLLVLFILEIFWMIMPTFQKGEKEVKEKIDILQRDILF